MITSAIQGFKPGNPPGKLGCISASSMSMQSHWGKPLTPPHGRLMVRHSTPISTLCICMASPLNPLLTLSVFTLSTCVIISNQNQLIATYLASVNSWSPISHVCMKSDVLAWYNTLLTDANDSMEPLPDERELSLSMTSVLSQHISRTHLLMKTSSLSPNSSLVSLLSCDWENSLIQMTTPSETLAS